MRGSFLLLSVILGFLNGCGSGDSLESHLKSGQQYLDSGNQQAAIIEFKNAVKLDPENTSARSKLGQIYFAQGKYELAAKEFDRAIRLGASDETLVSQLALARLESGQYQEVIDGTNPDKGSSEAIKAALWGITGVAYLQLGDPEQAKKSLEKGSLADRNDPTLRLAWSQFEGSAKNYKAQRQWLSPLLDANNPEAWSQLGDLELNAGNARASVDAFTKSIEARQTIHPDLMRRAMAYLQLGEPELAQKDIDKLVSAKAQWVGVNHVAGLVAMREQKFDVARNLFLKVLSDVPGYAPSQYPLAIIERRSSNLQSALSLLEQYTDKIPGNLNAQVLLADTLLRLGKGDRALILLKGLAQSNSQEPRILALLGVTFMQSGDRNQAIEFFKKTIELDPKDLAARMRLAKAFLSQPSTESLGRTELLNILKIDPKSITAELELFNSYGREKNYTKAREVAARVAKNHPDKSTGGNLKAQIYLLEKKTDEAIKELEAVLQKQPNDSMTNENLAKIYAGLGEFTQAKTLYARVLDNEPSNAQVMFQMASIAAREGDQEQVLRWLNTAVDKNPEELAPKLLLASELVSRGLAKQADQLLSPEESNHASDDGLLLTLAQVKFALKDYQQSLRLVKSIPERSVVSQAAKMVQARIYSATNDRKNLRSVLNALLSQEPDSFFGNVAMARLDLVEGEGDDFASRVSKLTKLYPNHPAVVWLQSKQASKEGKYSDAIADLTGLMDQHPNATIAVELALNQWRSGHRLDAIAGLEVWQKKNPDDLMVLYNLGQFYAIDERESEALGVYKKLAKLMPNNPLVLNNLAWMLRDSDPKQGAELARKALELEPNDANYMDTLAMLYLKSGEAQNALVYAEGAAQRLPGADGIQLNYAKALAANGEKIHAARILNRLLETSTDSDITRDARRELSQLN